MKAPAVVGIDHRTVEQIMASIPLVTPGGERDTACRDKIKYTSPDNARRGAIAWAWAYGEIVADGTVVYECPFCEAHHSGRSSLPRQGRP